MSDVTTRYVDALAAEISRIPADLGSSRRAQLFKIYLGVRQRRFQAELDQFAAANPSINLAALQAASEEVVPPFDVLWPSSGFAKEALDG